MGSFVWNGNAQVVPTNTYTGKPVFQIVTKRNNALLGVIKVELFPNIAPKHVRNFDSLVSVKFYDTTAFHRVVPGFVIQGGDPNSRHGPDSTWGNGDPSQPMVNAEFSQARHLRGILSAARDQNINSANSQFFICVANAPSLNGQYSVYGRVVAGMKYVDTIVNAPRDLTTDRPFQKIEMFVSYVGSNDTVPNPPLLITPLNNATNVDTANQIMFQWNSVSDGIIYHFDLSTDSTFSTINNSYNTSNLVAVTPNYFPPNTKYYWRVRTNNGGHFSAFSPVRNFKTAVSDVGIKKNMAAKQTLLIYPNPGNGKFTFNNILKGDLVEIFDLEGRLVYKCVAKEVNMIVDLEGREKGVYTYKVIGNSSSVLSGKLILK
ncbi:MAG: hypothetical protein JWO32_325 [Bacteroidetes bacterium]|nr:hypothetical protein [Bacteroidota bacterium]